MISVYMSSAYESIKKGLDEAIVYAKGKKSKAIVHAFSPVDVKNIRANISMSQGEFASAINNKLKRYSASK